jgi:hypothetical protein
MTDAVGGQPAVNAAATRQVHGHSRAETPAHQQLLMQAGPLLRPRKQKSPEAASLLAYRGLMLVGPE